MRETLYPKATEFLKKLVETNFKGVPARPAQNDFPHCLPIAGKLSAKHKMEYFIVPTAYGWVVSPKNDAKNTYKLGRGYRITPEGDCYAADESTTAGNKTADLNRVIDRITQNVWNKDLQKRLIEKVTNFVHTKNKQYDLTREDASEIYQRVHFDKMITLSNGNKVEIDWTNHAEFRSDLRNVDPQKVNEAVQKELNKNLQRHQLEGDERLKQNGVGTIVLDYDIHRNPGEAAVVTVWAKMANKLATEFKAE